MVDSFTTKRWYETVGYKKLNSLLLSLRTKKLEKIYLSSSLGFEKWMDKRLLAFLIKDDGIRAQYWKYSSEEGDDDIIIRP